MNREAVRAGQKEYYQKNRETLLEYGARYKKANPEKYSLLKKAWKLANPEKHRANYLNRKARMRDAEGYHTGADLSSLFVLQDGKCAYCNGELRGYHVDHIIPLSKGGSNWPDNICLACPTCNMSKSDKILGSEWCPEAQGKTEWV